MDSFSKRQEQEALGSQEAKDPLGAARSPGTLLALPMWSQELALPGSSWLFLAIRGSSWLLLALPGSSCLILALAGSSWLLLAFPCSSLG